MCCRRGVLDNDPPSLDSADLHLRLFFKKWADFVQKFRENCRGSRADMWLFLIGTIVKEDCFKPVVIF
jgi:hypothetical protein